MLLAVGRVILVAEYSCLEWSSSYPRSFLEWIYCSRAFGDFCCEPSSGFTDGSFCSHAAFYQLHKYTLKVTFFHGMWGDFTVKPSVRIRFQAHSQDWLNRTGLMGPLSDATLSLGKRLLLAFPSCSKCFSSGGPRTFSSKSLTWILNYGTLILAEWLA